MTWENIKKIIHSIEREKRKSKSNSATSYLDKAINDLQSAQEEEEAYKKYN